MIRALLATTALATLLATGAIAQDATKPAEPNATTTTAAPTGDAMAPADAMAPSDDATAPAEDAMEVDDSPFDMTTGYVAVDTDNLVTRIVGAEVWSSNQEGADNIGNVNDLVIGENGSIEAVLIGVGGFLGIGEKNVAVPYSEISWEIAPDGNEVMVLATTAEALTGAPDFVWVDDEAMTPAAEPAAQ